MSEMELVGLTCSLIFNIILVLTSILKLTKLNKKLQEKENDINAVLPQLLTIVLKVVVNKKIDPEDAKELLELTPKVMQLIQGIIDNEVIEEIKQFISKIEEMIVK